MSEPDKSPEDTAAGREVIPPLTRNGYVRLQETDRQIRGALDCDAAALRERAKIADEKSANYLGPEALVFFIRRANAQGQNRQVSSLFEGLISRCTRFFRGKFRGFSEESRSDLQQQVLETLSRDILAADDRGDFAQARFWTYIDRKSISAVSAELRRSAPPESLDAPISSHDTEGDTKVVALADPRLSPEDLVLLSEGLAQLPADLREIFVLRHQLGFDIGKERREDEDPANPSLAVLFNVSSKTVQNRLRLAEAALESFRKV